MSDIQRGDEREATRDLDPVSQTRQPVTVAAHFPPASPTPWAVYKTGDKISIKDGRGKFVLRKTVSQVSMEEYKRLSTDFDAIVRSVNGPLFPAEELEKAFREGITHGFEGLDEIETEVIEQVWLQSNTRKLVEGI